MLANSPAEPARAAQDSRRGGVGPSGFRARRGRWEAGLRCKCSFVL